MYTRKLGPGCLQSLFLGSWELLLLSRLCSCSFQFSTNQAIAYLCFIWMDKHFNVTWCSPVQLNASFSSHLVIPPSFQVYRLHQLNRAAQLVTALTFSVRGTETTNQTLAIMNSLGALLTVLQILGVICVWSLSSFLMRFLPSSDIPDPWFLEVLVELWNMGIASHCKLVIGYTEPVHMFARFSISLGLLDAIFGWVIGEKLTLESNKQQIKGLWHRCFRAALVDQILSLQVDQFCKKVREI